MRNKFAIEAKKSSNHDRKARTFDLVKLAALTSQQGCQYGFYVDFPCGGNFSKLKSFKISYNIITSLKKYNIYQIKIGEN
jgi:hypothetical protein